MANLNDFFGDGLPRQGEIEINIGAINDLSDVSITAPAAGYTLRYDTGYWVGTQLSYADLSSTGIPDLDDLANVNAPAPTNGQILSYDTGTSSWVATSSVVTDLDDLTDVTLGSLNTGEVLRYNGAVFVNDLLAYTDLDPGSLPTIPVNGDFDFTGLADATGTAVADGYLRWNGTGTTVEYVTIDASDLTGLATVATTGLLSSLTDTNIAAPSSSQILVYNGSDWVNTTIPIAVRIQDGDNDAYIDVSSTDDRVIIQAGPSDGAILLNTSASNKVIIADGTGDSYLSSVADLYIESTSNDVFIQAIKYPSVDGTIGQAMITDGAGNVTFQTIDVSETIGLDDLTDVTITGDAAGHVIISDGAGNYANALLDWAYIDNQPTIVETLGDLTNVNVSADTPSADDILVWTGSEWDVAAFSDYDLDSFNDVQYTAPPVAGQVLKWNGGGYWEPANDSTTAGPTTLAGLSDTNITGTMNNNQVLRYDTTSSKWINTQLSYTYLLDKPTLSAVATTGLYSSLSGTPVIPTATTGLSDVQNVAPSDGDILIYVSANSRYEPTAHTEITTLDDVPGVVLTGPSNGQFLQYNGTNWINYTLSLTLNDISAVTITGPVAGEYLRYDGADFVNDTIAYADITGTPTIPANIDDLGDVDTTTTPPTIGDTLTWDGTDWVPNAISVLLMEDADADTYITVTGTDDQIDIVAGPDGGDIVLTPNTSVNTNAAVVISGTGDSLVTATNDLYVESTTGDVIIQNLVYPSVDGTSRQAIMTDGAGNLTFSSSTANSFVLKYDINPAKDDVNLDIGTTPLPSGWTETSLSSTNTDFTITHSMGTMPIVQIWLEMSTSGEFSVYTLSGMTQTNILSTLSIETPVDDTVGSRSMYVKMIF